MCRYKADAELIEWSLKLRTFLRFYAFSESKKVTFYVFSVVAHVFSNTGDKLYARRKLWRLSEESQKLGRHAENQAGRENKVVISQTAAFQCDTTFTWLPLDADRVIRQTNITPSKPSILMHAQY